MNNFKYEDCAFAYSDGTLVIGNSMIERTYTLGEKGLMSSKVSSVKDGHDWVGKDTPLACDFPFCEEGVDMASVSLEGAEEDCLGLSEKHLLVTMTIPYPRHSLKIEWKVFPESPFITTRAYLRGRAVESAAEDGASADADGPTPIEKDTGPQKIAGGNDVIESLPFSVTHMKTTVVSLFDQTDINNHLLQTNTVIPYSRRMNSFSGNAILLDDYVEDKGMLVVKEGPTPAASLNRSGDEFKLQPVTGLRVVGSGIDFSALEDESWHPCYGATVGLDKAAELMGEYRRYCARVRKADPERDMAIMSNTWGDRNQDKAVRDSFIRKEADAAEQLGVDILQIDDGWQKGVTANSALATNGVWEGYYDFDPEFWSVNPEKFPDGLAPLVEYANGKGIDIALWFSPDSTNDFGNWRKDAVTLFDLYEKFGICHFKLDGIKIRSKKSEVNLVNMLHELTVKSGGRITFNMDTTAEIRFGYLYEKEYGMLFLENRYSDWGNYFPHNTLKNLWLLSHLVPPQRFQIEVL
ncbi:MAG: alpha-galactosidase, partial [Planctomycetes bacterium]|nr:alpha-galactosidase [Planctomycetota bacterium]